MSLLKRLWALIVSRTSTAPELAVVEEVQDEPIEEIFVRVCANHGVGLKILEQTNAVQLFVEWFEGDATDECVLGCIPEFMAHHPSVNAKFQRFFS